MNNLKRLVLVAFVSAASISKAVAQPAVTDTIAIPTISEEEFVDIIVNHKELPGGAPIARIGSPSTARTDNRIEISFDEIREKGPAPVMPSVEGAAFAPMFYIQSIYQDIRRFGKVNSARLFSERFAIDLTEAESFVLDVDDLMKNFRSQEESRLSRQCQSFTSLARSEGLQPATYAFMDSERSAAQPTKDYFINATDDLMGGVSERLATQMEKSILTISQNVSVMSFTADGGLFNPEDIDKASSLITNLCANLP